LEFGEFSALPKKYWQDECHFSATPLHCKYQPFIAFLLRNFKKLQKNAKKSNFLPHFLLRGRVGKFCDFFEKKTKKLIFLIKIRFFLFKSDFFDFFSEYAVFILKIGEFLTKKRTK